MRYLITSIASLCLLLVLVVLVEGISAPEQPAAESPAPVPSQNPGIFTIPAPDGLEELDGLWVAIPIN